MLRRPWWHEDDDGTGVVHAAEVPADDTPNAGEHAVEGVHGEVPAGDLADVGDLVIVTQGGGAPAQARGEAGSIAEAHRALT